MQIALNEILALRYNILLGEVRSSGWTIHFDVMTRDFNIFFVVSPAFTQILFHNKCIPIFFFTLFKYFLKYSWENRILYLWNIVIYSSPNHIFVRCSFKVIYQMWQISRVHLCTIQCTRKLPLYCWEIYHENAQWHLMAAQKIQRCL